MGDFFYVFNVESIYATLFLETRTATEDKGTFFFVETNNSKYQKNILRIYQEIVGLLMKSLIYR